MKILYVITQGEMGGAQLYVKTLTMAAKSQNLTVKVAIGDQDDNWLSREIEALGAQNWPLKHLKRPVSPINDLLDVIEMAKLYQKIQPDIIHLNSSKAGVIGSLAAFIYKFRRPKAKVIYTAHGWVFNEPMSPLKNYLYRLLERATSPLKDKIICVSEFDRQVGLDSKIASTAKLITIHNGLSLPDNYFLDKATASKRLFESVGNASPSAANNQTAIGVIANFYPTKGLEYLIEATRILVNDYKLPLKTIIIGEGELRHQLESQIQKSKLQANVILTGSIKEASKYLKALDMAVMPSVKEGFPYFLLEAMAAGLPLIATKVGGIPEIISDGENGYLIEPKNSQALADKIKLLIDNPDLKNKISNQNLIDIKEKFRLKAMIDKTFSLYR